MSQINDELPIYKAARDLANRLLVKNLTDTINAPGFDATNFSHLLSQDGGGAHGINPLHGIFPPESVAHARKFLAATELLDQYYASIPDDPEAPLNPEPVENEKSVDEQE